MISPEILRRYPFFSALSDSELRSLAMITEQVEAPAKTVLFQGGEPARSLFLLMAGSVDLYDLVQGKNKFEGQREFQAGEINPGEVFAISALIEPYILTLYARASVNCSLLQIDAGALRGLCDTDLQLAYKVMKAISRTALQRLSYTRAQLAAAWA